MTTVLYSPTPEMDNEPSAYAPPSVETLREQVKELRRVLAMNPDDNVARLLRESLEGRRNFLSALLLRTDRTLWEMYQNVLNDANNGVPPTGVLTRADAEALFGP